ncbi:Band 7 protein [Syntrophomonas zehnderi OL-4]|uniref:Band 7 protein n=1 Tax=Syntrophomonas zehnderi OL-4 TaxID=690567 RepID=A0A0E4GBP4_9FIRM|nr:SPFH domain-containing protein [Syntrophomonas zehnderi]CFX52928.1 Band 7 protein [Syntrophomonas zehnderi OL-4]
MIEKQVWKMNGFLALFLALFMLVGSIYAFFVFQITLGLVLAVIFAVFVSSVVVVQPNEARAITFFGKYIGTVRDSGFWMTVPFTAKPIVSLRVSNFNSKMLKVNDTQGNPIEIAAVIVYRVVDTAKALFEVNDYEQFVEIQSETALRHVATKYPYDDFNEDGYSLRGNADQVANELAEEIQERLKAAGVKVIEARLTHLAYATEIASAMLQRQQAAAIIAARQKIVEGAVGMVQMALEKLENENIVALDDERKAVMINNLMVAIVSEHAAAPVINAGSLY